MSPEPYYSDELVTLHLGDCLTVLATMEDASVDAVVCDPPYGLEFMGCEWDTFGRDTGNHAHREKPRFTSDHMGKGFDSMPNTYEAGRPFQRWCELWATECLRVLKSGGHLLAFGGTRTWHRLACAVEDAGFEIRDSIDWIYGSGFPKNPACLKPAHEPIVMARKPSRRSEPLPGLDACRVAHISEADRAESEGKNRHADFGSGARQHNGVYAGMPAADRAQYDGSDGRWPPNILLGAEAAAELDRQSGASVSRIGKPRKSAEPGDGYGMTHTGAEYDDAGGASRFFPVFRYEPKAPKSERPRLADGTAWPTVKPLDLMRWLVRLVTPPDGLVLDLFAGSGTTGEACVIEGFRCILIDKDPVAAELIKTRLSKPIQPCLFDLTPDNPAA